MEEEAIIEMPVLSAVLSRTTSRRLVRAVSGRMNLSSEELDTLAKNLGTMAKEAKASSKAKPPAEEPPADEKPSEGDGPPAEDPPAEEPPGEGEPSGEDG